MKANRLGISAAAIVSVFLSCCGPIMEQRLECPLFVSFCPDVNYYGCRTSATVRILRGDDMTECGVFPAEELLSDDFCIMAERGENICSVISGGNLMGRNVIFRTGELPAEVYALQDSFFAGPEDEEYMVMDTLCRQVAPVTLTLKNDAGDEYPLSLSLHSSWAGFDIISLLPLAGECSFPVTTSGNTAKFNVPRQGDDSLVLEFARGKEPVYRYRLGEAIAMSGYDWTASNLKEIEVSINYSFTTASIKVGDWREQIYIEKTI